MSKNVYTYSFTSESGDDYDGGGWLEKPTEKELAQFIIFSHWQECEYWLEERELDYEWAMKNPEDALEICLIYPTVHSNPIKDKIPEVPMVKPEGL